MHPICKLFEPLWFSHEGINEPVISVMTTELPTDFVKKIIFIEFMKSTLILTHDRIIALISPSSRLWKLYENREKTLYKKTKNCIKLLPQNPYKYKRQITLPRQNKIFLPNCMNINSKYNNVSDFMDSSRYITSSVHSQTIIFLHNKNIAGELDWN